MISVALIFLNISKICNGKLNTLVTAIFTRHFDLADLEDEENAIRPLASHDQLITYKRLILCKVNMIMYILFHCQTPKAGSFLQVQLYINLCHTFPYLKRIFRVFFKDYIYIFLPIFLFTLQCFVWFTFSHMI